MSALVMKSTDAALRIGCRGCTAAEITSRLGIQPSRTAERGIYHTTDCADHFREEARWILDSGLSGDRPIEEHIAQLLDIVEQESLSIQKLPKDCEIDIWCTISSESGFAGICLDQLLMKRIAAASVNVIVSVYAR